METRNFLLPKVEPVAGLAAGRDRQQVLPALTCPSQAPDAGAPQDDPFGGSCWFGRRGAFVQPVLPAQGVCACGARAQPRSWGSAQTPLHCWSAARCGGFFPLADWDGLTGGEGPRRRNVSC